MASAMIELLEKVLTPFEEDKRAEMVSWVEKEMERYPLIDNLTNTDGVNWQLGQESPGSGCGAIVWAMLYNEPMRAIIIYTVAMTPQGDGQVAFEYFREVCFNPKHNHGPISGSALYIDLAMFVQPERDEPATATNGAGAHP